MSCVRSTCRKARWMGRGWRLWGTTWVCITAVVLTGQPGCSPCATGADMEHWRSLRFGMFVHWGPVALTGHEIGWSRGVDTPIEQYDRLYESFNPVNFDPDEWVRIAQEAGMKYLVLTTKHHDGFCLWDTQYTDYNIMQSPYGKDILGPLAEACRRGGIEFGAYYSVIDFHHSDHPLDSLDDEGHLTDKPHHNLPRYLEYLKNQVTELMTRYGPLLVMWFDVPYEVYPKDGKPIVELVRQLQPNIVINNRAYQYTDDPIGDYDTPEKKVGSFNRERPWETIERITDQWAWKPAAKLRSREDCLRMLIYSAGGDGNLLLNVGPRADGRIDAQEAALLRSVGQWLEIYGEGIYATRGGPFKPGKWGASTCKGKNIYLFIEHPSDGGLTLPALPAKIVDMAPLHACFDEVFWHHAEEIIHIGQLPKDIRTEPVTVFKVTLASDAFAIDPVDVPEE